MAKPSWNLLAPELAVRGRASSVLDFADECGRDAIFITKRAIPKSNANASAGLSLAVRVAPKSLMRMLHAEASVSRELSLQMRATRASIDTSSSANPSSLTSDQWNLSWNSAGCVKARSTAAIPLLHAVLETETELQAVIDRVDGPPLLKAILDHDDSYTEADVARIIARILRALVALKKAGISLRCILPEKLRLKQQDDSLDSVVLDGVFSAAVDIEHDLADNVPRRPLGSTLFAAPDCDDSESLSQCKPDIWSVGILMSLLLAGKPPQFPQEGQQLQFESEAWAGISDGARRLVSQMLLPYTDRPDAAELLKDKWFESAEDDVALDERGLDRFLKEQAPEFSDASSARSFIVRLRMPRQMSNQGVSGQGSMFARGGPRPSTPAKPAGTPTAAAALAAEMRKRPAEFDLPEDGAPARKRQTPDANAPKVDNRRSRELSDLLNNAGTFLKNRNRNRSSKTLD